MLKVIKHSALFLIIILFLLLKININISTYENKENKDIFVNVKYNDSFNQIGIKYGSTYKDLINQLHIDESNISSLYADDLLLYNNQTIEIRNKDYYISINNSPIEELIKLPGIGEKTALKIIEYRQNNNGFKYLEELKNVNGIGDKKYEKIKELISL